MAKKGVVIFDGEDMFINPKKAIYSKARGEARNASFLSARGDDGPGEEESPSDDGPMGKERIMREGTSGGGSQVPSAPPVKAPPIFDEPIAQQIQAESQNRTAVEPDTITIKGPIAEIPTIVVPPILPPNYVAPVPAMPTRPTRPGRNEDEPTIGDDGGKYSGGGTSTNPPLYTIDDGTPAKQVIDTPRYVAPVPPLPEVKKPPAAVIIADPLGGGGSPVLIKDKEVPKLKCPEGFFLGPGGECVPTEKKIDEEIKKISTNTTTTTTTKSTSADPCAGFPKPQLAQPPAGQKWQRKADCSYELVDDGTGEGVAKVDTSTTTTTTTKKVADKVDETTTSTTSTTTTKKAVKCNPPIYAPPRGTRWKDLGNCTFTTEVDPNFKDSAPVPPLPPTPGQPITINFVQGGLGTVPTTSTTVQTTTLAKPSGGGASGGGGGTPFPEEPAPVGEEAPKKNYFWWYVGGALAVYLLIKRKKSQ